MVCSLTRGLTPETPAVETPPFKGGEGSSRDQPLAILDRNAKHAGLNLCSEAMIKSIAPSPRKGDRGNGWEISAKRSTIELKGEEVRVISERLSRDLLEYASKPRFYALVAKVVFIYLKMLRDSSQRRS